MTGILRSRYGFRVHVQIHKHREEKHFPPGTPLATMQRWREETRVALRKRPPTEGAPGTLHGDALRYLAQVKAMPTYAQRAAHIQWWLDQLGPLTPRTRVTAEAIRAILQRARAELGPATCNKRRTALMHLWTVLDGKGARNPVRDVPKFPAPHALPRGRDPHLIDAALKLAPECRSRACCRVLLWTGMRPEELNLSSPDDVDLEMRTAIVRTVKGGRVRVVPLTPQAVSAWREFIDLDCWQRVPLSAPLNRWLKKRTGIPNLRVYDLRHSYGTALARQDTRLDVIGALMGHSTLELTKRYTLAAITPDAKAATDRLAKRGSQRGSPKSANKDRAKSA